MLAHRFANRINLIESLLYTRRTNGLAGSPNRKENRVQAPFAHPRNINIPVRMPHTNVEFAVEEALSRIVVCINDNRGEMKLLCCFRYGIASHQKHSHRKTDHQTNSAKH